MGRAGANQALHLTGPALQFSETSRSMQPTGQVNADVGQNMTMELVAESVVFASRSSQRRRKIRIRVTRPQPDPKGDFHCTVELRGLEPSRKIYGVDSFQALVLALRFLMGRISVLLDHGWCFYFGRDDDKPLDVHLIWLGNGRKYETVALSKKPTNRKRQIIKNLSDRDLARRSRTKR